MNISRYIALGKNKTDKAKKQQETFIKNHILKLAMFVQGWTVNICSK